MWPSHMHRIYFSYENRLHVSLLSGHIKYLQIAAEVLMRLCMLISLTCFSYLLLDCLGSAVFSPIKADIAGNITVSNKKLISIKQYNCYNLISTLFSALFHRKSRQCMTATPPGLKPCSKFWKQKKRCMEPSGQK